MTRQKNNDFARVSLLHRHTCIARRIAVTPEYKSTLTVILLYLIWFTDTTDVEVASISKILSKNCCNSLPAAF